MTKPEAYSIAIREACANPAPGPVAEAFLPEPITVAGMTFRPFVLADLLILERLDSPLFRLIVEAAKAEGDRTDPPYSGTDAIEAAWLFSHTPSEARALLARGREVFRDQAQAELADTMPPWIIAEIKDKTTRVLLRAIQTAIAHQAPKAKDGEGFTAPVSAPTTALAGSSMSSAISPATSDAVCGKP
jgi:hypothetical protein